MKPEFVEKGRWILPKEGSLGNKAQNLLDNTDTIEKAGFKIPKSLVIPFEYLNSVRDEFIGSLSDQYFPDWKRLIVRSNAPDEDLMGRNPGLYVSEEIWHKDWDYIGYFVAKVEDSYNSLKARSIRKASGLEEKAMSLLIQEPITNDEEWQSTSEVDNSGCFSDMGEFYLFTLTDHKKGLEAMQSPPLEEIKIGKEEEYEGEHSELVARLKKLSESLPEREGKEWEIEFVTNKEGTYIVQTTPIAEQGKAYIEKGEDSIFHAVEVVGLNQIETNGILYVPTSIKSVKNVELFNNFEDKHKDYCLATAHANMPSNQGPFYSSESQPFNICDLVNNASVILDITRGMILEHDFAPHLKQWMREGRIGMAGSWNLDELSKVMEFDDVGIAINEDELMYSPTKLLVKADEYHKRGVIKPIGEIKPFVTLSDYLGDKTEESK